MDKIMKSRLFRCLVCLLVICSIMVNCSPIRAKAVAVTGALVTDAAAAGIASYL